MTKTDVELLAFGSRADIAARYGKDHKFAKAGNETISISDLVYFLEQSGMQHKSYSKYTRADRIAGMLTTRRLYLSRLSELNDIDELINTPDSSRIYVASMCFGSLESMGMWKMYGGDESESVRLDFDGSLVRHYCKKQRSIYEVPLKDGRPTPVKGAEIAQSEIESWSFHDVAYKYGNALRWNGKIVGSGRCKALKDVWACNELATYVKRFGWAAENEVRLVVKLKTADPNRKWIAIDFDDAIKGMSVVLGPCYTKAIKIARAFAENGLSCNKIVESSYRVDLRG